MFELDRFVNERLDERSGGGRDSVTVWYSDFCDKSDFWTVPRTVWACDGILQLVIVGFGQ